MRFWDIVVDLVSGTVAHWDKTKRLANDQLYPSYKCLSPLLFGLPSGEKDLSDELLYFLIAYQSCFQEFMGVFLFQESEQRVRYRNRLVQVITPFKLNELNCAFHLHYIGLCSRESDEQLHVSTLLANGALFVYDKPPSYAEDWLVAALTTDEFNYMIKLREVIAGILKQGEYNTFETESASMLGVVKLIALTSQDIRRKADFREAVREEILVGIKGGVGLALNQAWSQT